MPNLEEDATRMKRFQNAAKIDLVMFLRVITEYLCLLRNKQAQGH